MSLTLNVDMNAEARPDVVADVVDYIKTVPENSLKNVIAWHVIEHLTWENLQIFIKELYRASAPGAEWSIRVPHCTSIHAANPQHRCIFSSTFWDFYTEKGCTTLERYGDVRIDVVKTSLRILALATGLVPSGVRRLMPNFIFNSFGRGWMMLCERFWPFRFDEIEWIIRIPDPKK